MYERRCPEMFGPAWHDARWLGRIDHGDGPVPILVERGLAFDMSRAAPTVAMLISDGLIDAELGVSIGNLETLLTGGAAWLLAPIDLQAGGGTISG